MFIIDGIKAIFKLIIVFIIFIGSIAYWLVDLVFNFSGRDIEGTDADYVESYFIIAKDVDNDKIRYYEVNGKGNKRSADKFESEKFDEVVDLDRCFESYIDRDKNKVLNKYLDNCYMINQNGEDLSNESIYQDIAIQVSLLEHDMFDIKIYKIGDEYYVTRGLNVNIYIPYDLFKYDIDNNKLIRICQTSDEEIIGFKKKDIYEEWDYDVKNAKSIILDDSIEVNGKKLDDKIRLVVYPTKNNNCKDDVKLYSQYENSNVYFVCIGEVEIVYHPNMSHVETINYNSKSNIDSIIRQMNIKEQYRDGGSIMYERESLRILKCNTVDGNKDIYIGYGNLEYNDRFCK